jgi:hypothetical protein
MNTRSTVFATGILITLCAATLRGDTVELKTGERLDGTFRQASAAGVVMVIAGQAMTIPLGKVQAIYFGAQKPTSASTSPPPFAEALDALRALRSVTESGVTFRDYAPRVLDAKVKVDRCQNSSAAGTVPVRVAMREYELASRAWSARLAIGFSGTDAMAEVGKTLDQTPEISKCLAVRAVIEKVNQSEGHAGDLAESWGLERANTLAAMGWEFQRPILIGLLMGQTPAILWSCASSQLTEAERLTEQPSATAKVEAPKVAAPKAVSSAPVPAATRAHIVNQ